MKPVYLLCRDFAVACRREYDSALRSGQKCCKKLKIKL